VRGRVRAFLPDAFESEGSEALLAVRPSFQAGNRPVPSPGSTCCRRQQRTTCVSPSPPVAQNERRTGEGRVLGTRFPAGKPQEASSETHEENRLGAKFSSHSSSPLCRCTDPAAGLGSESRTSSGRGRQHVGSVGVRSVQLEVSRRETGGIRTAEKKVRTGLKQLRIEIPKRPATEGGLNH